MQEPTAWHWWNDSRLKTPEERAQAIEQTLDWLRSHLESANQWEITTRFSFWSNVRRIDLTGVLMGETREEATDAGPAHVIEASGGRSTSRTLSPS